MTSNFYQGATCCSAMCPASVCLPVGKAASLVKERRKCCLGGNSRYRTSFYFVRDDVVKRDIGNKTKEVSMETETPSRWRLLLDKAKSLLVKPWFIRLVISIIRLIVWLFNPFGGT